MKRILLVLCVVAPLAACAAGTTASGGASGGSPDRLMREQVEAATYNNVYDLVRAMRPQWLRVRGAQSINLAGGIRVYLDNIQIGGPEELRRMPTSGVASIQFLNGQAASQRWGLDHDDGAILVLTRGAER